MIMTTLCTEFYETASELPDRSLFEFPAARWKAEESLTYGALALRSAAVAAVLSDFATRGDRALLLFPTEIAI